MSKNSETILKEAEELDVGEIWFKVLRLPNNVFGILEPNHWQQVISYLIIGTDRAMLFDTGMGIKDISKVVSQLTDLDITVVNSHTHFDHVGDNHRFDSIHVFDSEFAINMLLKGQPNETLIHDLDIALFTNGYPEGFNPDAYAIQPMRVEQIHKLHHKDLIDLGDRKLMVLHSPGHSEDSIVLHDQSNRLLFTGDTFYPDWLFAFFDDEWGKSNPAIYGETMRRLATLEAELDYLHPSHNVPLVTPKILPRVAEAFEAVNNGEAEFTNSELYGYQIRIHDFEGFSILTRSQG
jgi:glyoxylase-like metal-dependent hydrolase (beta-lactamase superfamily II)